MNSAPLTKSLLTVLLCTSLLLVVTLREDMTASAQGTAEERSWNMFRANPNGTGNATSPVPDTNHTFFEFQTGGFIHSSASYYDRKIFFGSKDSKVYSVDVATGTEVWSNATGGEVDAAPLVVNGVVYAGSRDHSLYAFNASTGELLWTFPTGGEVVSSAKFYDGMVLFGSMGAFNSSSSSFDGTLYALNATLGTEVWKFTAGAEIWSSPAVSDGFAYFGSLDGNLYCLWASNGTKRWNYSSDDPTEDIYSSPAVYNGSVFVGTAFSGPVYDGAMISVNATTGALVWKFETSGFVYSSPAIENDTVFFATEDEQLEEGSFIYALPVDDPDGNGTMTESDRLWRMNLFDWEQGGSSPAVSGGKVLVGSDLGKMLLCLNESTGAEIWNITYEYGVISSPTIADSKVFIASGPKMYGIGSSGLPILSVEIFAEAGSVKSGRQLKFSFKVTQDNQPVEGAFIKVSVTNGTLTQSGFTTFDDGTQSVKFIAPSVEENRTIVLTAKATRFGFEAGESSFEFIVEPAPSYVVTSSEDLGAKILKYSPYLIVIAALVVLNILIFLMVRKRRLSKTQEGQAVPDAIKGGAA